jgi:AcrR family transcriptional regulator
VNVAERRAEYLRIASRVFLEKGLGTATMQDVADAAAAPKVLIYRIFPSKKALLDAILDYVIQAINDAYQVPNFAYGGRAQEIANVARACPEPFLLVFRYSQAGVEQRDWAEAVTRTIAGYTLSRWFLPGPDASPGALKRAEYASRLNVGPLLETLIRWIEGDDGLDEEARLRWWGRISLEYHLATREAFQLGSAEQKYHLPAED